jgi:hypothetical protein
MSAGRLQAPALCSVLFALSLAARIAEGEDIILDVAERATVGAPLEVRWQDGADERDFITIVPADAPEGRYEAYEYARQSPVVLTVPALSGAYEVRYLGALSPYPTLARRPLEVRDARATLDAPAGVEAGEEFSVEWTGPDHPGDFVTVVPIDTPEGRYGPIAESLRLIAADVAGRSGPLLVILVTDGEETCDGDPAAVIRELAGFGTDVRVNIVGFAIDELMLKETFAEWAGLGNGKYFNASDGAELAASLRESVEVPYAVLDAAGETVVTGTVNGLPVSVDAGTYRIVVSGRELGDVVVRMEEETRVDLDALP